MLRLVSEQERQEALLQRAKQQKGAFQQASVRRHEEEERKSADSEDEDDDSQDLRRKRPKPKVAPLGFAATRREGRAAVKKWSAAGADAQQLQQWRDQYMKQRDMTHQPMEVQEEEEEEKKSDIADDDDDALVGFDEIADDNEADSMYDAMLQSMQEEAKEAQAALHIRTRQDLSTDLLRDQKRCMGDLRLEGIRKTLNQMGYTRSQFQKMFHDAFIAACLPMYVWDTKNWHHGVCVQSMERVLISWVLLLKSLVFLIKIGSSAASVLWRNLASIEFGPKVRQMGYFDALEPARMGEPVV
jgi:hypothetical protein